LTPDELALARRCARGLTKPDVVPSEGGFTVFSRDVGNLFKSVEKMRLAAERRVG
jgi:hypothetical protein